MEFPVYKYKLENGFSYLLIPMEREIATVQIVYKVGSKDEEEGKRGISHLLEHMMFKGTEKVGPEEYSRIVQRLGGVDNAFTTEDFTLYYSTVPSKYVYKILDMEADRMVNSKFYEFESEKKVVIEERKERTENSPFGRFWEALSLNSYLTHPYRYPIIGFVEDLEHITKRDLKNWYDKYYTPSNSFLVIAGGYDEKKLRSFIEKKFKNINKVSKLKNKKFYEPEQKGERKYILNENSFLKLLGISFQIVPFFNKDFLPLSMLSNLLGGTESSRLYRKLVLDENLCNDVSIFCEEKLDKGLFIFYSTLNQNVSFEKVIDIFWEEVEKIEKGDLREEELEKVKNILSSEFLYRMQSSSGRAFIISHFELHGDYKRAFEYLGEIKKITLEDVRTVCKRYINKNRVNYTILC